MSHYGIVPLDSGMSPYTHSVRGLDQAMHPTPVPVSGAPPYERRQSRRYPITARAVIRRYWSRTRDEAVIHNLSVDGAFFRTETSLRPGEWVQLAVDWPASAEGCAPLVLTLTGFILRSDNSGSAMLITQRKLGPRQT